MARGKKRQVGADAAQGRQPNTRSVKKQRMEEIVIDEEPSAACLRNSEQEEQLPSVRQATGARLARSRAHAVKQSGSVDIDELESDADCQIVSSLTHLENHRPIVHRPMKRPKHLVSPFNFGNVYVELADDGGKHTYRLDSVNLSIASPWFRRTLAIAPVELDHKLSKYIATESRLEARYDLVHNDQSDIPVLKRKSLTMYKEEMPPREIGIASFTERLNKVTPRISIEKDDTTNEIKPSNVPPLADPLCSIIRNSIQGTPVTRSQNIFDRAIFQLDGGADYPEEVYQDARGIKVEDDTVPQSYGLQLNRSSLNPIEHEEDAMFSDINAGQEVEESKNTFEDLGPLKFTTEQLVEPHGLTEDTVSWQMRDASWQTCDASWQTFDAHPEMSKGVPQSDQFVESSNTQPKINIKYPLPVSQTVQEEQSMVKEESTELQPGGLQPKFISTNLASLRPADDTQAKNEGDKSATIESFDAIDSVVVKIEDEALAALAAVVSSTDISNTVESKYDGLPKMKLQEGPIGMPLTTNSGEEVLDVPITDSEINTRFSLSSHISQPTSTPTGFSEAKVEEKLIQSSPKIDPVPEAASECPPTEQPFNQSQMSLDAPAILSSGVQNAQMVPDSNASALSAASSPEETLFTGNALLPSHVPPSKPAVQSPTESQLTSPPQTPIKAQSVVEEVQQATIIKQTLVVKSEVLDAYHFLFQSYYNIPPAISTTDVHQAVEQAGLLVKVAALYQSLPSVRPHICYSLLSHGRDLHSAILQNPPHFLLLSLKLRCAPIFREAIIHIVGQAPLWPWPVSRDVIPAKVLHLIETKIVDFRSAKNAVNTELFTSCLAKGNARITITKIDPGTLDTWVVVQMWHDWFCGAVRECNTMREKQGKVVEGNMYRLIARGGDSYLPIEDVLRVLRPFKAQPGSSEWGNWQRKEVEEDLRMMKEYAAKAVKGLVINRAMINVMGGEDERDVGHLTCVKVEENELPWVGGSENGE